MSLHVERAARYVRSGKAEAYTVEHECLVLNAERYTITKLNEVGSICWELLREHKDARQLAEELALRFDVGQEQALADAEQFLWQLLQLELIEHVG